MGPEQSTSPVTEVIVASELMDEAYKLRWAADQVIENLRRAQEADPNHDDNGRKIKDLVAKARIVARNAVDFLRRFEKENELATRIALDTLLAVGRAAL